MINHLVGVIRLPVRHTEQCIGIDSGANRNIIPDFLFAVRDYGCRTCLPRSSMPIRNKPPFRLIGLEEPCIPEYVLGLSYMPIGIFY